MVSDLEEEELKKRMEELGLDENEDSDEEDNEEGMTAPKSLNDQVVLGIRRFAKFA